MPIAQVDQSSSRKFRCHLSDSGETVQATALGNLQKEGGVVVGDFVQLKASGSETSDIEYTITEVLPRKNEIYRIFIRENRKKVMASNCDLLVIVVSIQQPDYKRGLIDRYLIRSFQWGVPAIVIFNKADLGSDGIDLSFEAARLSHLHIPCFEVSAQEGSNYKQQLLPLGFNELKSFITQKTVLFVGQSGVGKSHLITTLTGGEVNLKTRAIGREGKGTHTTTWSEIIRFDPYTMIDSPGIRSFSLEDVTSELLINAFPDIANLSPFCQFGKCAHDEKSQGCAFLREDLETLLTEEWQEAITSYMEDELGKKMELPTVLPKSKTELGKLILTRLESYLRIYDELKETPLWRNNFLKQGRKTK